MDEINVPLTYKQLLLLIRTLDFSDQCKPAFMDWVRYQDGHSQHAAYADQQLKKLRRKIQDYLHLSSGK